jgi:hypothetical protein
MKANELRIGNLFTDSTNEINVVRDGTFMAINDGIIECEPIPLTEDWLVKFGFIRDYHGNLYMDINSIDTDERVLFLHWDDPHDEVWLLDEEHNYEICSIQKVHQLQNLYFALTGKELESTQTQKI